MTPFQVHTTETAPEASRPVLEETRKALGVGQSTLTATEQQVAFLAVSVLHGCEYCVAGHTYVARSAGVPEPALRAIRERQPIVDRPRLQALRRFCEAVVRHRGLVGDTSPTRPWSRSCPNRR